MLLRVEVKLAVGCVVIEHFDTNIFLFLLFIFLDFFSFSFSDDEEVCDIAVT